MSRDIGTDWLIEQSVQRSAARRTFKSPEHRARWLTGARCRRRRMMRIDQWRTDTKRGKAAPTESLAEGRDAGYAPPSPINIIARREELASVQAAMRDRLTHRQREILRLFVSGATYEGVAAAMQMPIGTVKSQINRARQIIKEHRCEHS